MNKTDNSNWVDQIIDGVPESKRLASAIRLGNRWCRLLGYRNPPWVQGLLLGVPEGVRHDSAIRLAGWYYHLGFSSKEVYVTLMGWNLHNKPPMNRSEIVSIVGSTRKWEQVKHTPYMSDEEVYKTMKEIREQGGKM